MENKYDFSRKKKLEEEYNELMERLASVKHDLALEDHKADAFKAIQRMAEKFPFIYYRHDTFRPDAAISGDYYTEYLLNSRLIKCREPSSNSDIEISGVVMRVSHWGNVDRKVFYEQFAGGEHDYVALFNGVVDSYIEQKLIYGMTEDQAKEFIKKSVEAANVHKLAEEVEKAYAILKQE